MKSEERWKFACGGALQALVMYGHGIGMHQAEIALINELNPLEKSSHLSKLY